MMRTLVIALILGTSLIAAAKEKTMAELKEEIAKADDKKQAELYAKLAAMQVEAANDVYNTNVEQARSMVEQATDSAERAASASLEAGKREKKTEIDLRKLENRMEDVIRTWAFEDRSRVKACIDRIETARSKLLDRMFKK